MREYLDNIRQYLHDPSSWTGNRTSLLAERDSVACWSALKRLFSLCRKRDLLSLTPLLFNYQSYQGDPAVLAIVATREGTSATIIDNERDAFPVGFSWGQRLFFNQNGERASSTAQRLSNFTTEQSNENPNRSVVSPAPQAAGESVLNMVLVIQVPLKQKKLKLFVQASGGVYELFAEPTFLAMNSDMEEAVIGHGKVEGPYTEIDDLEIERDEDFPIRVSIQFYKSTSNGVVSEEDVQAIAEQIQRVYQDVRYVGSLVVESDTGRVTKYTGDKTQPAN